MRAKLIAAGATALTMALAGCAQDAVQAAVSAPTIAPTNEQPLRQRIGAALGLRGAPPPMAWDGQQGADAWTRATVEALEAEGITLLSTVPSDVMQFCPSYATQTAENRAAFWAGFLSAVARHEGGGEGEAGGLMRISADASRANGCAAGLGDVRDNMQCAVRILARRVTNDGAIQGDGSGWRGVARDWLSLRSDPKRAEIASWTRRQSYCR